jgi:hypothetical protein
MWRSKKNQPQINADELLPLFDLRSSAFICGRCSFVSRRNLRGEYRVCVCGNVRNVHHWG